MYGPGAAQRRMHARTGAPRADACTDRCAAPTWAWESGVVLSNAMLDPTPLLASEKQRRLKRSEFQQLVRLGAFDDERVELLYGVIVEMTSGDPEHAHPIQE